MASGWSRSGVGRSGGGTATTRAVGATGRGGKGEEDDERAKPAGRGRGRRWAGLVAGPGREAGEGKGSRPARAEGKGEGRRRGGFRPKERGEDLTFSDLDFGIGS